MPAPAKEPIGLELSRTSKIVSRAFDDVLSAAGASLPTWLVLVSLKGQRPGPQRELAAAIGVEGPTLTHHLNRMEAAGLITRRRHPDNRRIHQVELTPSGDALFLSLLEKVVEFDEGLRRGFSERDIALLHGLLDRLATNATPDPAVADE